MDELEIISEMALMISQRLADVAFSEKMDVDTSLLLENFSFDTYKLANQLKEINLTGV